MSLRLLRKGLLLMLAGASLALGACTGLDRDVAMHYVTDTPPPARDLSVAVMPLANLTNQTEAGMIMGLLVGSALYDSRIFDLKEGTGARAALIEAKVDAGSLGYDVDTRLVGGLLDVDAVLVGAVTEYGYKFSLREEPAIGLTLRLIRTTDGKVLWAASDAELGGGFLSRDSLSHAGERLADRMVTRLEGDLGR